MIAPVAFLGGMVAWAFAGAAMWNWFIAPLGVPEIDALAALGISMTAWFFLGVAYGFEPQVIRRPLHFIGAAAATFAAAGLVHAIQVWVR